MENKHESNLLLFRYQVPTPRGTIFDFIVLAQEKELDSVEKSCFCDPSNKTIKELFREAEEALSLIVEVRHGK